MKKFLSLTMLFIFLISAQAFAGFDVSKMASSELQKAQRHAKQFSAKVEQAEDFIGKHNFGMAQKRLDFAQKEYDKIIDVYKMHPEVVKDKALFDRLSARLKKATAVEDAEDNIKKMSRKLQDAEKNYKWKKTDIAEKFLGKALALYEELPENFKTRADVVQLKKEYDALEKQIGAPAKQKATAQKSSQDSQETYGLDKKELGHAKRYADRLEKTLNEGKRFYDEEKHNIAVTRLERCEYLYSKIPEAYRANQQVTDNYKLCTKLYKESSEKVAQNTERIEKKTEMLLLGSSFDSRVRKISGLLTRLNDGKNNTTSYTLSDLESLIKWYPELAEFENECNDKYKEIFEVSSDREYEGFTSADIADLLKNKEKYRNSLIEVTAKKALKHLAKRQEMAVTELKTKRQASGTDLDLLSANDYKMHFYEVKRAVKLYEWAKMSMPQAEFKEIDSYQNKIKTALNDVKNDEKFNKKEFSYTTKAMKKAGEAYAKSLGMELIYVGMPDDSWNINKNDLGIPLSKYAYGKGLYHKKGEDFYRAYNVTIAKSYNGGGYDPVSSVKISGVATIYKK